jgi:signal transduction histidine kinase
MIEVSDSGWGIPEEERGKVFDRFFRGEKALSMQISGTGLGLAVAQEIMALHGGRITVESRVGEGSTFTVWLPLEEEGQTA